MVRILEGYVEALERGCPPDPDEFVAQHPELGDVLKGFLDQLEVLHREAEALLKGTRR